MKINCLIVDDEPIARRVIRQFIAQIDFMQLIGEAENPMEISEVAGNKKIDLIFMDIQMPKISGIKYLKISKNLPLVVITTAYPEHALEGYELDILDYLVKPIPIDRFWKACTKAKDYLKIKNNLARQMEDEFIFIRSNNRIEKVTFDELLYIEAKVNYVILYSKTRSLIAYLTLKKVLHDLPAARFIKVHKSFIVNISNIAHIEGNYIHLGDKGEKVIPLSQNMKAEALETIVGKKMIKR